MKPVLTLVSNATVAKLIGADDAAKDIVTNAALLYGRGRRAHGRVQSAGGWNGRSSFFSRRTCTFPAGFVHMVTTS
jgi:hypothetical protein